MYLRSSWQGFNSRAVAFVYWVTVVLTILVVSAWDGLVKKCFVEGVADLLLLIDLLAVWREYYLSSVWACCNGEEELQAAGWTHPACLELVSCVVEEHLHCSIIFMLKVNVTIQITYILLRKLPCLLIICQIEVLLLPTVTDPAYITHIPSFELVVRVRLNAINSANHSFDNRQRVFAVLFFSLDQEALVVYES